MSQQPPSTLTPERKKLLWISGIGILVIVLGTMMPRYFFGDSSTPTPSPTPPQNPTTKAPSETREQSKIASELTQPTSEPANLGGLLTRLALGTVVVLILCAGTAWGIARWARGKTPLNGSGPLKVLARLPINQRCCVYLVQAGEHQLLAGVDGMGLKSLIQLPTPTEQDDDSENAEQLSIEVPTAMPALPTDEKPAPPVVIASRVVVPARLVQSMSGPTSN